MLCLQYLEMRFKSKWPRLVGTFIMILIGVRRNYLYTWGPFYYHGITLIPAWLSNYIHYKVWGELSFLVSNFYYSTVEVWEWISNFIPQFTGHMITYPCPD